MDEELDLTIESLFCREKKPELMLDYHLDNLSKRYGKKRFEVLGNFREHESSVKKEQPKVKIIRDLLSIVKNQDTSLISCLRRVFGSKNSEEYSTKDCLYNSLNYLQENESLMIFSEKYWDEHCDRCGVFFHSLNSNKDKFYGVCKSCNEEMTEEKYLLT
jgi:hypothetical protein